LKPKYENVKGPLTRIVKIEKKRVDAAEMCYIELVENELAKQEASDFETMKKSYGIPDYNAYWEKLLTQQIEYFANEKEKLRQKMLQEIMQARFAKGAVVSEAELGHIVSDIEEKYKQHVLFLSKAHVKSRIELEVHQKKYKYAKYLSAEKHYTRTILNEDSATRMV